MVIYASSIAPVNHVHGRAELEVDLVSVGAGLEGLASNGGRTVVHLTRHHTTRLHHTPTSNTQDDAMWNETRAKTAQLGILLIHTFQNIVLGSASICY